MYPSSDLLGSSFRPCYPTKLCEPCTGWRGWGITPCLGQRPALVPLPHMAPPRSSARSYSLPVAQPHSSEESASTSSFLCLGPPYKPRCSAMVNMNPDFRVFCLPAPKSTRDPPSLERSVYPYSARQRGQPVPFCPKCMEALWFADCRTEPRKHACVNSAGLAKGLRERGFLSFQVGVSVGWERWGDAALRKPEKQPNS